MNSEKHLWHPIVPDGASSANIQNRQANAVIPKLLAKNARSHNSGIASNASNMVKNACKLLGSSLLCTDKDINGNLVLTKDNHLGARSLSLTPAKIDISILCEWL